MSVVADLVTPMEAVAALGLTVPQATALRMTAQYTPYGDCRRPGDMGRRTVTLRSLKRLGFVSWEPKCGRFLTTQEGLSVLEKVDSVVCGSD